ncbi:MAG: hypothetical protein H0T84_13750 [Tatlockia sp.]|nr:hypothetical protein [Tatlockia sp.]
MESTTRGSEIQNRVPDTNAIVALIEVVTEPESVDYACVKFDQKFKSLGKNMVEEAKPMRATLEEHRRNIHLQRSPQEKQWAGLLPESDYRNYQTGRAAIAGRSLQTNNIVEVQVDYAISNSSQFLRAYSSKESPLEIDSQISVDELLSTYLSKNNLFAEVRAEGTFIYENDGNGHIRLDEQNNPLNADPERVRELLQDKNKGFQKYLQEHGIKSNLNNHPFPEEAAPAPTPQEAPAAKPAKPEKPEPTPESGPAPSV